MTLEVKEFAAKADDLSLILGIHMVERENQLSQVFSVFQTCTHTHTHLYPYINNYVF